VVFTLKVPERWAPGAFDLAGSSHNLWHVLVFLAGSAWLEGMLEFYEWRRAAPPLDCAAASSFVLPTGLL
jgi:adiponectin receptor